MPSKTGPAIILLLSLVALYFALHLKIDNRHELLLDQSSEEARAYARFQEEFGDDRFVIVALSGKPLFDEEALDVMLESVELLEAMPYVDSVRGMPVRYREDFGAEDPEALEEELTSTPFYQGLFLSADYQVAGLLVETTVLEGPRVYEVLVSGIREAVAPLEAYGFRVDLIGGPVTDVAINELSFGESFRMFPIAAVASLLVLIWQLRSLKATAVVLICGALTLLLTFGLIGALGRTLNIVTSSLPLILWVLSLANCIHIVSRYQLRLKESDSTASAIADTLSELWFSCSLASVTTALGFVSLVVADVGPIQELGAYMAAGMVISLGVNLVMCPFLLAAFGVPAAAGIHETTRSVLSTAADVAARHPAPFIAAFGLLVVWGTYGATHLRTEVDTLKLLPENSDVLESYRFVTERLTGLHTLEVVIDTPGGWVNPEYWPAIEAMAAELSALEPVARVYTPLDFVKKANQWDHDFDVAYYALPETQAEAEDLLEDVWEEAGDQLHRFATGDGGRIRMSVLIKTMDANRFIEIVDLARTRLGMLPPPLTGDIAGMTVRMQAMQLSLIATQIKSFGLAFVLVFAAIFIGLRSVKLTLLAFIPNVMPLLSVFAVMVTLDIALDVGTVMVASISLGIAVDDTVHFLVGYRRHRRSGEGRVTATRSTVSTIGPSLVVTTVTACIGFFTLSQSSFPPVAYLGLLSGIAILFALVADLVLLPAILAVGGSSADE